MSAKLKLTGTKELEKALADLGRATGRNTARRALKKSAQIVADEAQILVPVDQGELMDSIIVSTKLNSAQRHRKTKGGVDMHVGPTVYYGHFVEFGTVKQSAQPFMRPAWESNKEKVLGDLGENLWAEIDRSIARRKK